MAESKDLLKLTTHHLGLSVPDVEASITWYRDNLGFTLERRDFLERANARVAFIKNGEFRIELFEVPGAATMPPNAQDLAVRGVKHLAFRVNDIRGLVTFLKGRGVEIVREAFAMPTMTVAFIRDNSGIQIELVEVKDAK